MTLLGFDRSHFNAEPDFAAFKAGGGAFVGCKATDGVGWADLTFPACRTGTHAAGLVLIPYHFAEWGDPAAEARWYLQVSNLVPGDVPALDAEAAVPAGVDVVAWSLAFCQAVHAAVGAWPLIYMNQSWAAGYNWASVAATDGLWLAKYDGVPTGGPLGAWQTLAMKQYTDAGTVPGEAGQVDVDAFQGDLATLLKYAVPGTPTTGGGSMTSPSDPLTELVNFRPSRNQNLWDAGAQIQNEIEQAVVPRLDALAAAVTALQQSVAALAVAGGDPAAVTDAVLTVVADRLKPATAPAPAVP